VSISFEEACEIVSCTRLSELDSCESEKFIIKPSKALVDPGEAVGIIVSQSISKLTTQIAVSSFHSPGTSMEVLEGIPRVESIMNGSFKKSSSTIYLLDSVDLSCIVHLMVSSMVLIYYVEDNQGSWWCSIAGKHGLYKTPTKGHEGVVFRTIIRTTRWEATESVLRLSQIVLLKLWIQVIRYKY
jgi:DNA-directed RNA polymerase II subunit RPB1